MELHVSHESRKATTKCPSGLSCLTAEPTDLCAVETYVDGKVQFIKCLHNGSCSYQHPFGRVEACMCPVRKELFTTYNF